MIKIDLKAKGKFCKPDVYNDSCSFMWQYYLIPTLCAQKHFFFAWSVLNILAKLSIRSDVRKFWACARV